MSQLEIHREAFKEEAYELLAELENSLLELEERPKDTELIGRVFRAMHTIKGSSGMFDFDDIAGFTHEVETVFDMVRNGKVAVTGELIEIALDARDVIKAMLDASFGGVPVDEGKKGDILKSLKKLLPDAIEAKELSPGASLYTEGPEDFLSDDSKNKVTYRIRFRPNQNIFANGMNPANLLNELKQLGECNIIAQTDAIPELNDVNPELCYTYWDIILSSNRGINSIKDVFIFAEDDSEIKIEIIDEGGGFESETDYKKLGEILLERGDLTQEDLIKALDGKKKLGEVLVESGIVNGGKVQSALLEQEHVKEARKVRQNIESYATIRVNSEKLDKLVNLVGELVTVQARLTQSASVLNDPKLNAIAEETERLTWELRDSVFNIRMLPIGTAFAKLRRFVHDLSGALGKEVELITEGAETELDKTVLERLNDPLVHIVRNCIDHGIEPPDARIASGKPQKGIIHLSAFHAGTNIVIRIRDDGAGIDKKAVRSRAINKGLLSEDSEISDKDLFSFILKPGFSTAKEVTNFSGRGVGMDVVKKAVDALRGTLEITSEKGIGTTIAIRLPLTLSIIEGLLVKIGERFFVLPLSEVIECVELKSLEASAANGRCIANLRGDAVPYIKLREHFDLSGKRPEIEQIIVAGIDGVRIGFVVDVVVGVHQTVIKTMGRAYRDVEGVSGATILGDGTVAFILDLIQVFKSAETREKDAI